MAAIHYGHQCFDRDWMVAGPQIGDEDRQGVLFRISVEEFLYDRVECMGAQPDEDNMVPRGCGYTG